MRVRTVYQCLSLIFLVSCHAHQGQFYHVRRGDTATQIAHVHDIAVTDIQKANPQKNLNRIIAGERLWIPSVKKVSRGDAQVQQVIHVQKPNPKQNVTVQKKTTQRNKETRATIYFDWPYNGKIISAFGKHNLKMHNGIDIEIPSGESIRASQSGKVAYVGDGIEGYGQTVIVQHPDTLFTIYAYLGGSKVSKGQPISRGQSIGYAKTQSNPSFFHFEIRKVKTALNPESLLSRDK